MVRKRACDLAFLALASLGRTMQIYLPIAEVSVNAFLLLGLGGLVG
ncbi:MAG: permease, partial [Deltaproteobacteria bacterium]|nr:permease [Deltaproteobacteria bacterium]